jgi:hypothetical protein
VSGYRQARDPREIAAELHQEALEGEARAMSKKHGAEAGLLIAQHEREIALTTRGSRVEILRHLRALVTAETSPRPELSRQIEALESEIVAADAAVVVAEVRIAEAQVELKRSLEGLGEAMRVVRERKEELQRSLR